ncbi:helix-turn-helix transcriptional regulator [Micromonospora fluostatini]
MSSKDEVREFLISRRAHVTPEQAGLPDFGGERRVPGLRREEVALLAGVSLDYYTRLERGNIRGASESVLNAVARALQLDDVERQHLFDLARTAPVGSTARSRKKVTPALRTSVQRVLDNLAVPAIVYTAHQDLIASNLMGRALFSPHFEAEQPNLARFVFFDRRARDYYVDWPLARRMTAAMLRLEAGRDPLNSDLTALIGELSTRSPQFRADWAARDVHEHRTGRKVYRHPEVGELEVTFDVFEMPGEAGTFVTTYSVDEGSDSADRLALLASWAATGLAGPDTDGAERDDMPETTPRRADTPDRAPATPSPTDRVPGRRRGPTR